MTLLSLENLTVAFDDKRVVDGASLSIAKGETLGLVGESGSGKSMIASAIAGLLPAAARGTGRLRFDGAQLDIANEASWTKLRGRRIGFVFQDPFASFDPLISVGAQIAQASFLAPEPAMRRAMALLDECGLPDPASAARAYPHQLSGGQLQRAGIAAAIAAEPDLLIADEPTTALDVSVQAQVLRVLKAAQARHGMAMLFISHDLAVVGEIADRIAVMRDGHIVETGPVAQVLRAPAHEYTRLLLASRPAGKLPGKDALAPGYAMEAKAIDFAYPARRRGTTPTKALDGVSLKIPRGACFGLVGESGSGKSTLGRIAIGLLRPAAGTIRVCGLDPMDRGRIAERARRAQMVFQDAAGSLNPRLTIEASLSEPFALHRIGVKSEWRDRAASLLGEVGLAREHLARYPHELSGGQRQRVAIARALALDPEFLVCDEPVTALDMTIQAQILALLRKVRDKRGVSMLFIGHDIGAIETLADRIAVMKDGRVIEEGTAAQVLNHPLAAYTRTLLDAVPRFKAIEALATAARETIDA